MIHWLIPREKTNPNPVHQARTQKFLKGEVDTDREFLRQIAMAPFEKTTWIPV